MNPNSIIIFTDGSSRGNPGPGGFGAIIIAPKNDESGSVNYEVTELGGREEHTTNNRMELRAAIRAFSFLKGSTLDREKGRTLVFYPDSSYLVNGITKWVSKWQKNNWRTSQKKDVENRDLWQKLAELTENKNIEWNLVKGHVGVAGNHRCDEIATTFALGKKPALYSGVLENYRIKNILDLRPKGRTLDQQKGSTLKRVASRVRSHAKAYSYVSELGGVVKIHKTWAECERRVKGKPARFKKALSAEDETTLVQEFKKKK